MENKNLLDSIHTKSNYIIGIIQNLKSNLKGENVLWYHSIAIINSIYAIKEEIFNRLNNSEDKILKPIIKNNIDQLGNIFKQSESMRLRNKLTHNGDFSINRTMVFEDDHANDTSHPEIEYSICISGVEYEGIDNLLENAESIMKEINKKINEINGEYISKGGKKQNQRRQMECG